MTVDTKKPVGGDSKKDEDEAPRHRERALAAHEGNWEIRAADDTSPDDTLGVLRGHFAVFRQWTEIDSFFEGRFLEQIAPGAFTKTFKENLGGMRCLFQHGRDPQIGMKPLGPIREVGQDDTGASYEVDLMDTGYNRDLAPGLRAGQYGASFRFQIIREEINEEPGRSKHNPDGIPERTISECRVREFGPVTFGAYENATAGLRSMNDELLALDLRLLAGADPERLATFLNHLRSGESTEEGNGHSTVTVPRDATTTTETETETTPAADAEREETKDDTTDEATAPSNEAPDEKRTGLIGSPRSASTLPPSAATGLFTPPSKEARPKWML